MSRKIIKINDSMGDPTDISAKKNHCTHPSAYQSLELCSGAKQFLILFQNATLQARRLCSHLDIISFSFLLFVFLLEYTGALRGCFEYSEPHGQHIFVAPVIIGFCVF